MEEQAKLGLGSVISVSGARASVRLLSGDPANNPAKMSDRTGGYDESRVTIGKLIAVRTPVSLVIGVVSSVSSDDGDVEDIQVGGRSAEIDFLGEIMHHGSPGAFFQRGVSEYPAIGDRMLALGTDDISLIHHISDGQTINVGRLQMDASVPAYINFDELLHKHFAILGTTGVGKSSTVALVLREILNKDSGLRVLLVDPHNEYGRCFGDMASVVSPNNLKLPFWLFNFEEIVDVIFRGRSGVEEETEILSDLIPIAKARFATASSGERVSLRKNTGSGYTPDTPVPYRISDLIELINERMGKLENRSSWMKYHSIIMRLEALGQDSRYAFMFDGIFVEDMMSKVIGELFRLPIDGQPITVMQLSGFPSEVVDSVVSVLCRMAFEVGLWSDGTVPVLVACEESHRYAPSDPNLGFAPTRRAISRIAKEGRKYNVFLGVITQRPADLDATILSQCSTVFAMRLANDRDQAIVRSAVPDAGESLIGMLASLGNREAIAFGEGVALPTKLRFADLAKEFLPRSQSEGHVRFEQTDSLDDRFVEAVIDRWRQSSTAIARSKSEMPTFDSRPPGGEQQHRSEELLSQEG